MKLTRIALAIAFPTLLLVAAESGDWPSYGRDPGGQRFSPLAAINRGNVKSLKVAWTFRTGDAYTPASGAKPTQFEATPLYVDGTLFLSTPLGRVIALEPTNGKQRWSYDAHVDKDMGYGDFASRGVSTWKAGSGKRRIFIATIDARLIAIDAATGLPCTDFGKDGTVNLRSNLRIKPRGFADYEETSPPAVVGNTIVVGSGIQDNSWTDEPSGEVRAFDVRTVKLKWTWDPIPQGAAVGADTWEERQCGANGRGQCVVSDCSRRRAQAGVCSHGKRQSRLLRRRTAGQ